MENIDISYLNEIKHELFALNYTSNIPKEGIDPIPELVDFNITEFTSKDFKFKLNFTHPLYVSSF